MTPFANTTCLIPFQHRGISSAVIKHVYKILVPVSMVSARNAWDYDPPFGDEIQRKKNSLHFMTFPPTEAGVISNLK